MAIGKMSEAADVEPLEKLAQFSWQNASTLCLPEHGCKNYHQTWSTIRLVQLGGALPAGADFFRKELGELARAGKRRVLVSGGADTGVTTMVVDSYLRAGVKPHITFVDRCKTPCEQNRILLRELDIEGEVRCIDAVNIDGGPFDAIVWHSFLHNFDGAQRELLLRAWAGALAPGGAMVMSTPLAPNDSDTVRIPNPSVIAERQRALTASALQAGWPADEAASLGAHAAAAWANSGRKPPALTRQVLEAALAQVGLNLQSIDVFEPVSSPSNMGTPAGERRIRVQAVAVRPEVLS